MTRHRGFAIAVLAAAMFVDLMDATIVNVALHAIQTDLDADPSTLEWVVGGYALAFAAMLVTGARLGDRHGRRTLFILGLAGFTLASAACAFAPDATVLVGARIVQGGFAAVMVPQLLSTVQAIFSPAERGPMYGMIGAVTGLAAVAGPILGGWLVTNNIAGLGWRSIFWINVPIGVLLILAALAFVPDTRAEASASTDLAGVLLLAGGVGAIVYGLIEGGQAAWPVWIFAVIAAGIVLTAGFVAQQLRREANGIEPLVPMRLFTDRGYSSGLLVQWCFQAAMIGYFLVLAIYLQAGLGFTAWQSGLALTPFSIGGLIGSGIAVPLGPRLGKTLVATGAMLLAAGTWWSLQIALTRQAALTEWDLLPATGIAGIGLSLLVVPLIDIALAGVPIRDAGAASGTFSTIQQLGAAFGAAIVGLVFFGALGTGEPAWLTAFERASWVVIGGFTLSALACLALPNLATVQRHRALTEPPVAPTPTAAGTPE